MIPEYEDRLTINIMDVRCGNPGDVQSRQAPPNLVMLVVRRMARTHLDRQKAGVLPSDGRRRERKEGIIDGRALNFPRGEL